jgi:hypothetical protein
MTISIPNGLISLGVWNRTSFDENLLNKAYMSQVLVEYCKGILADLKINWPSNQAFPRDKSVLFKFLATLKYLKIVTKPKPKRKIEVG